MQMLISLQYIVLIVLLLCRLFFNEVSSIECEELNFSAWSIDLGQVYTLKKMAVVAPLFIFYVFIEISDDQMTRKQLLSHSGSPLVIYSSLLPTSVEWQSLDILAKRIYLEPVYQSNAQFIPNIMLTACKYETPISYFNDQPFTVDTHKVGIVSMYENQLNVQFRTFENGIFIFSLADQGDLLIAQIIRGTIHIIFDFGSLSHSTISGGLALNDGEWHDFQWVHQFDSVQLIIDGVIMNTTTPSGLYRKLDFDAHIHVAGRPPDDMSEGIEISFHGCLARLYLNNIDLLAELPTEQKRECQMPRPQLMTIAKGGFVEIPFSFLPFSIEFRILPQPTTILMLSDAQNDSLLVLSINQNQHLSIATNKSRVEQVSHPVIAVGDGSWHSLSLMIWGARLNVDVDGLTVMWLEGSIVRSISKQLAHFHLSAIGCYRSATVAFRSANFFGDVTLDTCKYSFRCAPNPCENDGICEQITLNDYHCICKRNFYGRTCHSSQLYRSCEEWFSRSTSKRVTIKNVSLDLDGGHLLRPVTVQCARTIDQFGGMDPSDQDQTITTTLYHNLEPSGLFVSGYTEPGSIRKTLQYGLELNQIDRFVDGFEWCEQYMRYECRGGAKLMTFGYERRPSSWYATRNGQHGLQWADAAPYSRMCSCAINSSCIHNRMCNCDSGEDAVDEGFNSHMQLLPIMNLYLGGTTPSSSINVSIGALVCSHRSVFDTISLLSRDIHLSGSQSFAASLLDISMHVRFGHPRMNIFTWQSVNAQRWYQLYTAGGQLIGQLVNGGNVIEIESDLPINDDKWHHVYWEVHEDGMVLKVDGSVAYLNQSIVLPHTYTWIIGSRTQHGLSGYAGMIRNLYLCGKEIQLSSLLRKLPISHVQLIKIGERGVCRKDSCANDAICTELYDSYVCNCSTTPFTGPKCDQDIGMSVPKGSHLSIPWQHPAHKASCFRIAIQSYSLNYSLIRAKALFADSEFNLTVNEHGYLDMSVFDGFFFHHRSSDTYHRISDNEMADIRFCADKTAFTMTINNDESISMQGNWTFFEQLNVWNFLDKNFTGCITRLQVGSGFPLKDPSSSRLSYKGDIRFGSCPFDQLMFPSGEVDEEQEIHSEIQIHAIVEYRNSLMILAPIIALVAACAILLLILTIVCWIRNRPDGVYKTNENILAYCSPSRSEEPLVVNNLTKEYFC